MTYLAKQIALKGSSDPHEVIKLIGKETDENDHLSWLNIGWIDENNIYVFDRKIGLINPPYNLSHRPYVQDCLKMPGQFFTSQVVIGAGIGIRKIPGGIGIINSKGHFLGILCMGIKLADLSYRVQSKLSMANYSDKNISYVVLDKDLHIVLQSSSNKTDIESSFFKDTLESSSKFAVDSGNLITPVIHKDITYTHYKKVKNFPYFVLTGYNKSLTVFDFIHKLFPYILGLIIIAIIHCALLYSERKRSLRDALIAGAAKSHFLRRLGIKNKDALETIHAFADILIEDIKNNSQNYNDKEDEKRLNFLEKIQREASKLFYLIADELEPVAFNFNQMVLESIQIISQDAMLKNVEIKSYFYSNLPEFTGDELRLQQVVLGFLSISLDSCPYGSTIIVNTALHKVSDKQFIKISIEDNGVALNKSTIHHLNEKFGEDLKLASLKFDLYTIEKLIQLHEGEHEICAQHNHGKKITVILPYQTNSQKPQNYKLYKENFKNNIIPITVKNNKANMH
jgi:hypothetical protein